MKLIAIVLTFNEEIHLARCLESILPLTKDIVVVDSISTDRTVEIATQYKARILQKAWENNHSLQVNWALNQLSCEPGDWILRIDADEVITPELVKQLLNRLPNLNLDIVGVRFNRKIRFQGKLIRFGGVGHNQVLRLFRYGNGNSEARWMDEHIKVDGQCLDLNESIVDDNLQPLSWWIAKHNQYASREAIDLLNLKYFFQEIDSVAKLHPNSLIGKKRWIKENIYSKLPLGFRAFVYFLYRYVVCGGFLDGARGTQFHFLQALWYRYLVDMKVAEVERYMHNHHTSPHEAIFRVFNIRL